MSITSFKKTLLASCLLSLNITTFANNTPASPDEPVIPRFSIANMDQTVKPGFDFYHYANGNWIKKNPVPADKSIWTSFGELDERNEYLLHSILEDARRDVSSSPDHSATRLVGNFYTSAMDTVRLNQLGSTPLNQDFAAISQIKNKNDLFSLLGTLHTYGVNALFDSDVQPDEKNSAIYAFQLQQAGLSLPDRDYYLNDNFKTQRQAFLAHMKKMFALTGETAEVASEHANIVMNMETELAKASRSRVELRDPIKNYNKFSTLELKAKTPFIPWEAYFSQLGIAHNLPYAIVGQPEFFTAVETMLQNHSIADWQVYLRWHVINGAASFLSEAFETENFNFYGKILKGQQQQEERWKRANAVIDGSIGEALGQLYVDKYFNSAAKERMNNLVNNLRTVFHDHLQTLDWMSNETRSKALAKFEHFTQKIGYPDKMRDYSALTIKADDYFGNVRRSIQFEVERRMTRNGKPIDKSEWEMTPPTVNAYFNPVQNEIVFPAGILQPPFFDTSMDDAVNYGAIAVVIGHEITHGYDDEGRHYNADGNLSEWWTEKDAQEFSKRAQKIVDEFNAFEMLPGLHVNGKLTLGENIADLGGISIAYDAMERALAKDPSKRKLIDGFTPEQRFFISYAQVWRTTIRDEEARRRITVDSHAPGRFRSFGPLLNYQEFYDAFGIRPGDPLWRSPERRAKIW